MRISDWSSDVCSSILAWPSVEPLQISALIRWLRIRRKALCAWSSWECICGAALMVHPLRELKAAAILSGGRDSRHRLPPAWPDRLKSGKRIDEQIGRAHV